MALHKTVVSRMPVTGSTILDHNVGGGTFSAAPTAVTDGFFVRDDAGPSVDAFEFTYSFDATADATTEAQVRPWFWVPDHDPLAVGGTWLAGKVMEGLFVPQASTDIQAPVRRINVVPVGATKMYLQVVVINGTAPANLYMVAYGIDGIVANVSVGDIQVDIEAGSGTLGAVKIEDATTTDRAKVRDGNVPGAATDHVLVVQHQGPSGESLPSGADDNSPVHTISAGGSLVSGWGFYISPQDFTALYASGTTLTLTGIPFVPTLAQFTQVVQINATGNAISYTPATHAFGWNPGTGVLTVTGASFAGTDQGYRVILYGPDKTYDRTSDFQRISEMNPYPLRKADGAGVELIPTPQNFTGSWADLGGEIPTHGYNTITLWLTLDINDTLDARIRLLEKHESSGVEEYPPQIESIGASDVKIEPHYWEVNVDADQLFTVVRQLDGVVPYTQPQISAGTPGGTPGQITAAYYTRGWR